MIIPHQVNTPGRQSSVSPLEIRPFTSIPKIRYNRIRNALQKYYILMIYQSYLIKISSI